MVVTSVSARKGVQELAIIAGEQRQLTQASIDGLDHIARTGDSAFNIKKSATAGESL